MTQYHVDAAQVAQASAFTTRSAQTIRTEVASMLAQLQALEGSWQGAAATGFTAVVQQWQSTQTQVDAALDQIALSLGSAAQHYQDAEDMAARMFVR